MFCVQVTFPQYKWVTLTQECNTVIQRHKKGILLIWDQVILTDGLLNLSIKNT